MIEKDRVEDDFISQKMQHIGASNVKRGINLPE
jgi:hypothetical protein